jgi:hypothetical protein
MLSRCAWPVLLLVLGLWLLAGCLYLPIPEHLTNNTQKDFRKLVGDGNSKRPLQTGRAMRQQVFALLGPPPYASYDDRSVAYVLETESGGWVYPLCFTATANRRRIYGLRIDFNEQGNMEGWEIGQDEQEIGLLNYYAIRPESLIKTIQRPGRALVPSDLPATRP